MLYYPSIPMLVCIFMAATLLVAPLPAVVGAYVDEPVCDVCKCGPNHEGSSEYVVYCVDNLPAPARWTSNDWRSDLRHTTVDIDVDTLKKVEEEAFKGLVDIDCFRFRSQNVEIFEERAFKDLSALQIHFKGNEKLTTLTKGSFEGLVCKSGSRSSFSMEKFDALTTMEAEVFYGADIKSRLIISENALLVKIEKNTFKGLQLTELVVKSNPKLTTLEAFAFNGVNVAGPGAFGVSIYRNGLTTLAGAFDGLESKSLNIFQNKLKVVEFETFKGAKLGNDL